MYLFKRMKYVSVLFFAALLFLFGTVSDADAKKVYVTNAGNNTL